MMIHHTRVISSDTPGALVHGSKGTIAKWSTAIDSKSIPFGGACSNHARVGNMRYREST